MMRLVICIMALMGGIALLFLTVDAAVTLWRWTQRIHIGRWRDRKQWQKAVERKARHWLVSSPPTVKKTDQSRRILWDMLRGNYRSSVIQSWQDAGLLLGLGYEDAVRYCKLHPRLFEMTVLKPDYALQAYALIKHNALAADKWERVRQIFIPYVDRLDTIPYRTGCPYRFVDTIGMVCPFLCSSGLSDLAVRQIREYDDALLQGVFPPHAYSVHDKMPLGIFDWSRGMGWYILAITETAELDGNKGRILNLAARLLPFQRKDGGFSCMVFNPGERLESSGSALMGLLFVKAYQLSGEGRYLRAAFAVERALMKSTRRNGAVDYAQGDTKGIGFYSNTFDIMPFAQGICLYLSKKLDEYETLAGLSLE